MEEHSHMNLDLGHAPDAETSRKRLKPNDTGDRRGASPNATLSSAEIKRSTEWDKPLMRIVDPLMKAAIHSGKALITKILASENSIVKLKAHVDADTFPKTFGVPCAGIKIPEDQADLVATQAAQRKQFLKDQLELTIASRTLSLSKQRSELASLSTNFVLTASSAVRTPDPSGITALLGLEFPAAKVDEFIDLQRITIVFSLNEHYEELVTKQRSAVEKATAKAAQQEAAKLLRDAMPIQEYIEEKVKDLKDRLTKLSIPVKTKGKPAATKTKSKGPAPTSVHQKSPAVTSNKSTPVPKAAKGPNGKRDRASRDKQAQVAGGKTKAKGKGQDVAGHRVSGNPRRK